MNGKLHDVYHLINKDTGLPLPGTGSPWPTVAQFEAHALNTVAGEEKYTVAVWLPSPRYNAPVGTPEERASGKIWPGAWVDATGYLTWYFDKWWHTGADLNLNHPAFDADAHSPVYAIADGDIYVVRKFDGWGNVICIRHAECLSRYAHVENIQVVEGSTVKMGNHLADIGNAEGNYPYHLHFDIARLEARMAQYPGDWPGADQSRVLKDYHNPKMYLKERIK